jgi:hypothetical protein
VFNAWTYQNSQVDLPVCDRSPDEFPLELVVFFDQSVGLLRAVIFQLVENPSPLLCRQEFCGVGKVIYGEEGEDGDNNGGQSFDDETSVESVISFVIHCR